MKNNVTIEISKHTIVFTVFFLLGLYLLWKINGIVVGLFIAFLIMTALNPLVTGLQKIKVPRAVSSLVFLLLIMVVIISGVAVFVPPAISQVSNFLIKFPAMLIALGIKDIDWTIFNGQLGSVPQNAVKIVSGIFDNALAVFATLVLSFYLLQEREKLPERIKFLFSDGEKTAAEFLNSMEVKLGGWIRGEVILCTVVGLMVYVGLAGLNVSYAVPLAIIAGILEIIPNIGPTVSMIPAAIVGFTISPMHGVGAVALYFIVQQIENNFLVPQIMRKVVGMNPLVTLLSLMVGYKLGGAFIAMLAIPIVLALQVAWPYFKKSSAKL